MIAAIHQPHFLPWLGYFHLMASADIFILLDDAPCERRGGQDRALIKTETGTHWLEAPIKRCPPGTRIKDARIDNAMDGRPRWGRRAYLTLREAYKDAPFFDYYSSELEELLEARWETLGELDRRLTEFMMEALGIRKPVVPASKLLPGGPREDRAARLCRMVGAEVLLGEFDGCRRCADQDALEKAGIRLERQQFRHPRYPQHPRPGEFLEGLSAVDLLFNCGPLSGRLLLESEAFEPAPARPR